MQTLIFIIVVIVVVISVFRKHDKQYAKEQIQELGGMKAVFGELINCLGKGTEPIVHQEGNKCSFSCHTEFGGSEHKFKITYEQSITVIEWSLINLFLYDRGFSETIVINNYKTLPHIAGREIIDLIENKTRTKYSIKK